MYSHVGLACVRLAGEVSKLVEQARASSLDTTTSDRHEKRKIQASVNCVTTPITVFLQGHRTASAACLSSLPCLPLPPSDSGSGHEHIASHSQSHSSLFPGPFCVLLRIHSRWLSPCVILPPNARNPAMFVSDLQHTHSIKPALLQPNSQSASSPQLVTALSPPSTRDAGPHIPHSHRATPRTDPLPASLYVYPLFHLFPPRPSRTHLHRLEARIPPLPVCRPHVLYGTHHPLGWAISYLT